MEEVIARNRRHEDRVLPAGVAAATAAQMQTVVSAGTGRRAAYGGFAAGKTGTTENFGDAWFVGFTHELTIAVWVGYPDATRPMKTEFGGQPVAGGTFPALIWRDFVLQAKTIFERRAAERAAKRRRQRADGRDRPVVGARRRADRAGAERATQPRRPTATAALQEAHARERQGQADAGPGRAAATGDAPTPDPQPPATPDDRRRRHGRRHRAAAG